MNRYTAKSGLKYLRETYHCKETGKTYKYRLSSDNSLKVRTYYSTRFNKTVTIPHLMRSDGATGAFDIESSAWWFHDQLCNTGKWDDGSKCTNWEASRVVSDILADEERYVRSIRWLVWTFALGGGEARKNGMFKLKEVA